MDRKSPTLATPAATLLAAIMALYLTPPLHAQVGPPGDVPRGGPPVPATLTVSVDCDAGESLASALTTRADELTVELSGTCVEDVTIRRDRLTVRGATPGTAVVGVSDAGTPQPAIAIEGASRVRLADFTIRDSDTRGLLVRDGASVELERMTLTRNASSGITVQDGSFARLLDVTATSNDFVGIAAWGNSSLRLGGNIVTSSNGVGGLSLSTGSGLQYALTGAVLEANDNGFVGINLQITASGQFASSTLPRRVIARRNNIGISLLNGSHFTGRNLEVTDNATAGVLVVGDSEFFATGDTTLDDNGLWGVLCEGQSLVDMTGAPGSGPRLKSTSGNGLFGIQMTTGCHADLGSCQPPQAGEAGPCSERTGARWVSRTNGIAGAFVEGGSLRLANAVVRDNANLDMALLFGSRAELGEGVEVGSLTCEPSVLTRGTVGCPPVAPLSAAPGAVERLTPRAPWEEMLPLEPQP